MFKNLLVLVPGYSSGVVCKIPYPGQPLEASKNLFRGLLGTRCTCPQEATKQVFRGLLSFSG